MCVCFFPIFFFYYYFLLIKTRHGINVFVCVCVLGSACAVFNQENPGLVEEYF